MSVRALLANTSQGLRLAAIGLSFGYISLNFIAEPILCSGPSMEPTIHSNNIILVERYSSVFIKQYNRGDIVVARCPTNPNTLICKRVVAIAGDVVKQGFLSQEVIPRGHVWLTGDNINFSTDSRQFGSVPIGLILGRVIARLWPPRDFQLLTQDSQKFSK